MPFFVLAVAHADLFEFSPHSHLVASELITKQRGVGIRQRTYKGKSVISC